MPKFIIYCHTHIASKKHYVGQSRRGLMPRWRSHVCDALAGRGCPVFGEAIRQFGPDAFTHEILETVETQIAASTAETCWIARLDCLDPKGYNRNSGGGSYIKHAATRKLIGKHTRDRWAQMTSLQRDATEEHLRALNTPERRLAAAVRMRDWQASRTPEQRQATANKASAAARIVNATRTPEQYATASRKRVDGMAPAQRSAAVKKQWAKFTSEQRSMRMKILSTQTREKRSTLAKERHAAMTPEQRGEIIRKGWAARGPEQAAALVARAQAWREQSTPEQRSEAARRGWASRRAAIIGCDTVGCDEELAGCEIGCATSTKMGQ